MKLDNRLRDKDLIVPNVTEAEIFKIKEFVNRMGLCSITREAEKL